MRRVRPTYIWRKTAGATWLAANEGQLQIQTGGAYAVIERPGKKRMTVEACCERLRFASELQRLFGGKATELPSDWEARSVAASRIIPLRVGQRLTIVSEERDADRRHTTLIIPAGMAFGTGDHATTAISLRILERITRERPPGWRMLDLGTGSGILALAGRCFGAAEVVAIDNEPVCIATAKANARRNRISRVSFRLGDVTQPQPGQFNVVCANLYSELLMTALPLLRENLPPRAHLILSGVMRSQEANLRRALRQHRYSVREVRRRGKWIGLLCCKTVLRKRPAVTPQPKT